MKALLLVLVLLLLFPVVVHSVFARNRGGDDSWIGHIQQLRESKCTDCGCAMLYITLETDDSRVDVKLAPKSYFTETGMVIAANEKVEVTGFNNKENGKEVILALSIRRGGESLLMRSRTGQTMWDAKGDHTCLCHR